MALLQLQDLPTELILQFFEKLSSPLDIHAFASASPVTFAPYKLNRHRILRPAIEDLETWLRPKNMLADAMLACQLRMIQHDILSPDTSQIEIGVRSILEPPFPHLQVCQSNLGMLCELFRLRSEARERTTAYAIQAWSVMEGETTHYIGESRRLNPPFPHVPLVLSESELRRLEQGYLEFEIYRHFGYRNKTFPTQAELNDRIKSCFPPRRCDPWVVGTWPTDASWGMRGSKSIFCFFFDKYIGLVRRVYMRIAEQRARKLVSKDSYRENIDSPATKDQCESTEEIQELDLNRRPVINSTKRHQELRCIASLCLRGGFSLLEKLQRMDYTDREHFIVTTFQEFRSRDQASGIEDNRRKVDLGFALEHLCSTLRQNSWHSGLYFWDTDRVDELRFRRRRADAQA